MRKFLLWLLLICLIPVSYLSYGLLSNHIVHFTFFSNTNANSTQNIPDTDIEFRRTEPTDPLAKPIVLFIENDMNVGQIESLPFAQKSIESGINGIYPVYPILNPDISIVNLLTGVSPDRGNYLSSPSFQSLDTVLISAIDSGYETAYFGNHLPTPPEEDNSPSMTESIESIDLTITASYVEPVQHVSDIISWLDQYGEKLLSYHLIIFDLPIQPVSDQINPEQHIQEVTALMNQVEEICGNESQYFFTSPLAPLLESKPTLIPQHIFKAPFYAFGQNIVHQQKPISAHLENIASTLCYSLGIPSPNEAVSPPIIQIFNLPEEEAMNRYTNFIDGQMMSYMNVLLSYGIKDEMVAGYILHVNDSVHRIPSKNLQELEERMDLLQKELHSFLNTKENENEKKELIFFIVLIALLSILWLLFLPWNWRGYIYGIVFTAVFIVLNHLWLKNSLILPSLPSINLEWLLLTYGLPLLITSVLFSIITTLIGGYLLNIDINAILKDINGQIGTFVTCIGIICCLFGFTHGYSFTGTLSSFFVQVVFIQSETILFMIPFTLLLMFGTAYLLHWLLAKKHRNENEHQKIST